MPRITKVNYKGTEYDVGAIDPTLTQSGQAADAKVVGDKIERVRSDLSAYGVAFFDVADSGYIATNIAPNNTVDPTVQSNNAFRHTIIQVTEGEQITINGTGWTTGRLWCFTDDNYVVKAVSDNTVTANNLVLTAPNGATKLIINMYTATVGTCYKGVQAVRVDTTLTAEGRAADAKVTGEKLTGIELIDDGIVNTGIIDARYFGTFELGDIQATTGRLRTNSYRIRTVKAKQIKTTTKIKVSDGYRVIIVYYSGEQESESNYISSTSWQTGEITITAGYVGIVIAKVTEDTSSTADISEFMSKVTISIYALSSPEYRRSKNNRNVLSVAHQGYSVTGTYYGNSRISSYYGAYIMGFDYGETDVAFSSDGIPVCCHDASFSDATTRETVVIADHTLAELKTYNYYGEKIASLDEVVSTCKQLGLGLFITHVDSSWSDAYFNAMFDIVDKYQMQKRVAWATEGEAINKILTWNSTQTILLSAGTKAAVTAFVNLANDISTAENKIIVWINYAAVTVDEIIAFNKMLNRNVEIGVWTVDDVTDYKTLLPYVGSITSNKIATNMLMDDVANAFKP